MTHEALNEDRDGRCGCFRSAQWRHSHARRRHQPERRNPHPEGGQNVSDELDAGFNRKGQGGCKSSDNGCKGKNSCKGKGGCATDGSKMPG